MPFLTYSSNIYDMIDEIVDQLVAADNTMFEKITTNNVAKACVHYTGNGENKYILFKATTIAGSGYNYFHINGSYTGSSIQGILITVGDAWDSTNADVTTNLQKYYSMLFAGIADITAFSERTYSHKLWVDKNGFFWNCWNPFNDATATGFLMCIEFLPTSGKEYNDSASGIIIQNIMANQYSNTFSRMYGLGYSANLTVYADNTYFKNGQVGVFQNEQPLFDWNNCGRASKSSGSGKVYFEFTKLHKNPGTWSNVFVCNKRLINCQKAGLVADDVLTWQDGENTRFYIVVQVGSALGSAMEFFAIPYSNPPVYT